MFGSPWSWYFASKFYFLVWIIQSDAGTWPKFSVCNFQYRLSGVLQNILATGQTCSSGDGHICWLSVFFYLLRILFSKLKWFSITSNDLSDVASRARSSLFILLRTFVKLGCCWVEVHSYHCKRLNRPEASSATAIKISGRLFQSWDRSRNFPALREKTSLSSPGKEIFFDLRTWPKFGQILNY